MNPDDALAVNAADRRHVEAARARRHALGGIGSLRRYHWIVIGLSLMLTTSAWWFARGLVEERATARFERETDHLVQLITERMNRYADALQAGVATIAARGGEIDRTAWRNFTDALDIDRRYPGINGIGVIRHVNADALDALVARERLYEPAFDVHPRTTAPEHFPIVYIEPLARNRQALGLDMAHEPRRLAGALEAVRSGEPRITAPIVLVQDATLTPGFLFFAPWRSEAGGGGGARHVEGLVYAPFIVRSLVSGMLGKDGRQVQVLIEDDGETIHDEHDPDAADHDPNPLFTRTVEIPIYGRVWQVEFRSNIAFREGVALHQPLLVLSSGLVIDLMLMGLFLGMSRASRAMKHIADMNIELESRAVALAETNLDLERFACVVSHDLKTPLRGIGDLAWYLEEDLEPVLAAPDTSPDIARNIGRLHTQVRRMNSLIEGILDYSAAGSDALRIETLDTRAVFEEIAETLALDDVRLVLDGPLPVLESCRVPFVQVMGNLVGNAIKHHPDPASASVRVSASRVGARCRFAIADDGAGIEPRFRERIFEMFQTLQPKDVVESTGVGLSIVRKMIERVGGRVTVEETPGGGATFLVDWPYEISRVPTGRDGIAALPSYPPFDKAA